MDYFMNYEVFHVEFMVSHLLATYGCFSCQLTYKIRVVFLNLFY